jgi:type II secretory pathway component GspD/PulD (secretin)
MKMHTTRYIAGATVVLLLAGTPADAQQEKIADQDLINLLETVNQEEAAPVAAKPAADTPVARAMETLEAAGERAADADAVMDDAQSEETEDVVDSLGMVVMDETAATSDGNLISVRLNRVGLEEAINLFAQLSGANIIVPELTEASMISVNLKDVEWRPALQSILDTYDYELYQKVSGSNVYSVRRRPPGAPEPQVVETFLLKYATVPNAATLIRELLPEDAKISEFASRNMIVVKSTESSLSEARAVLEAIDKVRQQVFIESKFMELSDDAQKDLGIDWKVLQGYGLGTRGETQNSFTKTDSSTKTDTRLTDVSGNPYEEVAGYSEAQRGGSALAPWSLQGVTPTVQDVTTKGATDVLTSVLTADEFRLVLSALEENKGVNIVSNPKIIVANEELANISIIRKEPNLKQEREQQLTDQPATTTFTLDTKQPFFDFGIKLDVLPSINTSSNITIQINPSLTRKFGDKQAGENTYPIIDEKSIKTVFNLASGQTAAIGGLTEVTEAEEERKVPVLGSIPYLGRLFSYKQTVRGQDETIIFVTVGLANTQEINEETGMPSDAELARRQIITDANSRKLRDQGRIYYQAEEATKLEDMMKVMGQKEAARIEARRRDLEKKAEKAAKKAAKNQEIASSN